ncbi:MAG: hypothetical protein JWN54_3210 [Mycobacterium sp.]|nr:hypothetical protein [Mycobacterium sp.]
MTGPVAPPPPPPPPMGQPPFGQPPYGQQPAAQSNTAQTLGIIGIIVGVLCCSPAGIVLGYLSMKKARENGQSTTLGKVALILSIVFLALGIIVFVARAMNGTTSP